MPKIRMRTTAAGPRLCRNAGWVYTVSREEADALVAAGAAERVVEAEDFADLGLADPKASAAPETAAVAAEPPPARPGPPPRPRGWAGRLSLSARMPIATIPGLVSPGWVNVDFVI